MLGLWRSFSRWARFYFIKSLSTLFGLLSHLFRLSLITSLPYSFLLTSRRWGSTMKRSNSPFAFLIFKTSTHPYSGYSNNETCKTYLAYYYIDFFPSLCPSSFQGFHLGSSVYIMTFWRLDLTYLFLFSPLVAPLYILLSSFIFISPQMLLLLHHL